MSGRSVQRIECPVLVVGGGPVGLALALFLAGWGIGVVLAERRTATSPLPRATHITRRTMELFVEAGIGDAIRAAGLEVVPAGDGRAGDRTLPRTVLEASSIRDLSTASVLETGDEELAVPGASPPFWCGQDRLEPILAAAARSAGADIRFGHEVLDVRPAAGGATTTIECAPSGERIVVHSRFVVAADGGRGRTAALMGVSYSGLGTVASRLSMLVRADLSRWLAGRRFFMCMIENPRFTGALMPLNEPHCWAVAMELQPDCPPAGDQLKQYCARQVRTAIGDAGIPVEVYASFVWKATHRIASAYRSGPLFVVGDAAHLHPPAGGYGSNVGFQDAHNLAWKVAAVVHGWAGDELLNTYDSERRPVGEATAVQSMLLDGVDPDRLGGAARRDPRTIIMGYRYRSSGVVGATGGDPFPARFELSGHPGQRVPYVRVRTRGGRVTSTLDLCRFRFALLSADPGWVLAARRVARTSGVPLRGYRFGAGGVQLVDPGGEIGRVCDIGDTGAVLIRPDGVVAWRVREGAGLTVARQRAVLAGVLRRILHRRPAANRLRRAPQAAGQPAGGPR
jgi:2-polyprenyl-6-methoxyphenol hydroxylase-like FAD-dependent oxidoreductase